MPNGFRVGLWFLAFSAVAAVRADQCLKLPVNSGDALRHAWYGVLVVEQGPAVADEPLARLRPELKGVAWCNKPYNYPVLALAIDIVAMAIHPSIFGLKAALTLLELLTALILLRMSGEKWLAFVYWASPLSMWWVSREGQFDAIQNLFLVPAVFWLRSRPIRAWILLGLAVQVKVLALFMLPFFLLTDRDPGRQARNVAAMVASFCVTALGSLFYSPLGNLHFSSSSWGNPYYWNPFESGFFILEETWLRAANQAASYGALAALVMICVRRRQWPEHLPSLSFLASCKLWMNVQPWYMLLLPGLMLPISTRKLRFILFMLVPLMDLRAVAGLAGHPCAFTVRPGYHGVTSAPARLDGASARSGEIQK